MSFALVLHNAALGGSGWQKALASLWSVYACFGQLMVSKAACGVREQPSEQRSCIDQLMGSIGHYSGCFSMQEQTDNLPRSAGEGSIYVSVFSRAKRRHRKSQRGRVRGAVEAFKVELVKNDLSHAGKPLTKEEGKAVRHSEKQMDRSGEAT
jgi:hypothetical protein